MKKIKLGCLNRGNSGGNSYINIKPPEGKLIFRAANGEETDVRYMYLQDKSTSQPDFVLYNVFTKK